MPKRQKSKSTLESYNTPTTPIILPTPLQPIKSEDLYIGSPATAAKKEVTKHSWKKASVSVGNSTGHEDNEHVNNVFCTVPVQRVTNGKPLYYTIEDFEDYTYKKQTFLAGDDDLIFKIDDIVN